jgi:CheY-like chemotaxis protein
MNGVIGMTRLLLDTPLSDEQREFADTISKSGDALLTLINDILDFSKIEAGKLDLEVIDFDLRSLLEDVTDLLALRAHEKKLELTCLADPMIPTQLRGDPGRVRQILINLVGNAIKFTGAGEVAIVVREVAASADKVRLRFEIRDTGIGIAQDKIGTLFSSFTQVDASTTRRYGGSGLGLSISKRLVELMGGEIGITSTLGQGSTFWFVLELPVGHEPQVNPSLASLEGRRLLEVSPLDTRHRLPEQPQTGHILVVEDNPVNQQVILHMLNRLGHQAQAVDNGLEALQAMEKAHFDLVLMDCQMPVMDGYEATRAIRAANSTVLDRSIPIIALTANAMQGDRELALAAGMDEYLSKPVDGGALATLLNRLLSKRLTPDHETTMNQQGAAIHPSQAA